ncbi:hypothetical protein D9758_015251 [Tetrapyrgos nigripes]|uniref:DUF6535 domain-containing protein n=1 Tax=Tetrapyrgos nigripes TaxID=182062 RepID=A0A8H5C2I9_9AGAR|nr:hypothetical protein D9758_015251 [Tetrapyrgos nigripes]
MHFNFKWLTNVFKSPRSSRAPGEAHAMNNMENGFSAPSRPPPGYPPFFAPPLPPSGPDNDKKPSQKRFQPTADDQACAGMWSIYIGEAERYDKSLVEGWKGDMEGMVIFSALYSASLTAFLIESYKTLQPDPAQDTVFLLSKNIPTIIQLDRSAV